MILYKIDTKGKHRFLEIKTEGSKLVQISGLIGTDNPIVHSKICKGKNIGKSNETTPEEQALLEMQSKINEKLTEGYFKSIKECENTEVILPMLAKSYNDEKSKIDWSKDKVYIQPKLDGMRCLAHIKSNGDVTLISRDGKIISNMEHIMDDLSTIRQNIILDGELYAHTLSFQENMKLIKKWREDTPRLIKFHVYDIINDKPFYLRKVRDYIKSLVNCTEVSTYQLINESEICRFHAINIENGYEGSIIRWGEEGYKVNGRSSNLLKYKDFQDIALPIKNIIPSAQRPTWGQPIYEINGKEFSTGMKFSHEEREEWLINKQNYIGKTGEIRFFEYSDDGIPRFPVTVGIRLDK